MLFLLLFALLQDARPTTGPVGGGVITGTVTDEDGEPLAHVFVQAMTRVYRHGGLRTEQEEFTQTDDRGQYRLHGLSSGRFVVLAIASGARGTAVYYPSATRLEDAQAVDVRVGAETSQINFELHTAVAFSVQGKVLDERGPKATPLRFVTIATIGNGLSFHKMAEIRADGAFLFEQVPSGRYLLQVVGDPSTRFVEVGSGAVRGLIFRLGEQCTLRIRVRAQSGELPKNVVLELSSRDTARQYGNFTFDAATVWEIKNMPPGSYDLAMPPEDANYFLGKITVGGRDVTDAGIPVPDGPATIDIVATLDFRASSLTGRVLDQDDQPAKGVWVGLVSANPRLRPVERYQKQTQSDPFGNFKLTGIVPGDYLLLACPKDEPVFDKPDILAVLEKYMVSVSIGESVNVPLDVRLTPESRAAVAALVP